MHYAYGLHERCSSLTGKCEYWPAEEHCVGDDDRYVCSLWRSVGFLMSFAVVIEGVTLIAFVVMLLGGKQKRVAGWKVLSTLLFLVAVIEISGMSIIVRFVTFIPPVLGPRARSLIWPPSGLRLRLRRPFLPWLEARCQFRSVHRQLEHHDAHRWWRHGKRLSAAGGSWLRAHSQRAPGGPVMGPTRWRICRAIDRYWRTGVTCLVGSRREAALDPLLHIRSN